MEPVTTEQEIRDRLAAIDKEIFTLKESIDQAPAPFQESTQGDDDASESELVTQRLAGMSAQIQELENERDALHKQLGVFQQAA